MERHDDAPNGLPRGAALDACDKLHDELLRIDSRIADANVRSKLRGLVGETFERVHQFWLAGLGRKGLPIDVRLALAEAATVCCACEKFERVLDRFDPPNGETPATLANAATDPGIDSANERSELTWCLARFLILGAES